jgi:hypothetical protein
MTDHITLRIGQEAPLMSLTGQRRTVCYLLVHETKKALLIAAVENLDGICQDAKNYWFPKSVILVDGEKLRCQAVNEAEDANIIQIPAWIWQKKEPAKPMGAPR